MGESQNQPFQLSFNRFLRVDFQGSRVTSDSGLLLVRSRAIEVLRRRLRGKRRPTQHGTHRRPEVAGRRAHERGRA